MTEASLRLAEKGATLLTPLCPCCGLVHSFYFIDPQKGIITTYHPARPLTLTELRQVIGSIPVLDFADGPQGQPGDD